MQRIGPKAAEVAGFESVKRALSLDSLRDAIDGMGALALAALGEQNLMKSPSSLGLSWRSTMVGFTALSVKGSGKANLKITLFAWKKL